MFTFSRFVLPAVVLSLVGILGTGCGGPPADSSHIPRKLPDTAKAVEKLKSIAAATPEENANFFNRAEDLAEDAIEKLERIHDEGQLDESTTAEVISALEKIVQQSALSVTVKRKGRELLGKLQKSAEQEPATDR